MQQLIYGLDTSPLRSVKAIIVTHVHTQCEAELALRRPHRPTSYIVWTHIRTGVEKMLGESVVPAIKQTVNPYSLASYRFGLTWMSLAGRVRLPTSRDRGRVDREF